MLDEHCDFEALTNGLSELLFGDKSALFAGAEIGVFVDYGSRVLSRDENRTLLELFMKQENFIIREWSSRTSARSSLFTNTQQKTPDYSLYKGTIRAGQDLQFEGDVIVVGDVNPSAQLSATGDIYIFGRLYGIAHAGSHGNPKAVIAATDFAPMQLRIADFVGYAPEEDGKPLRTLMEFAYVKNEALAVDKLKFLSSYLQERELDR
ncbi:septation ring formation regulator EzrA [Alicyclobacillus sp. SO9]|nr:septation ring formation regulator EzrA [Alicyclobacillus sp. SO9]